MTIVDAHAHVFAALSERYPRGTHPLYPAEREALVEDYIAELDAAGVDHAVVVALDANEDYVRDAVRRYPGRLAAVGIHDPEAADPVADLDRRVEESGLQGLRMFGVGGVGLDDVEQLATLPLLTAIAERGLTLWYYPFASAEELPLFDQVLETLPDLQVVLNHLGFCPNEFLVDEHDRPRIETTLPPPTLPQVLELARHRNVHVMFSGQYAFSDEPYPYMDVAPVSVAVYEAFGADRLLWATDYPFIVEEPGYARMLRIPDHHLPDLAPAEREAIMGGTVARLFGFAT